MAWFNSERHAEKASAAVLRGPRSGLLRTGVGHEATQNLLANSNERIVFCEQLLDACFVEANTCHWKYSLAEYGGGAKRLTSPIFRSRAAPARVDIPDAPTTSQM